MCFALAPLADTNLCCFAELGRLDLRSNRISGRLPSELGSIETLGRFLHRSNLFVLTNTYLLHGDLEFFSLWGTELEPWTFQPWVFRLTNLGKDLPLLSRCTN